MVRLILLAAFIGVLAFAVMMLFVTIRTIARADSGGEDSPMQPRFQRITYALLVVLLFGVTTGWLGGV